MTVETNTQKRMHRAEFSQWLWRVLIVGAATGGLCALTLAFAPELRRAFGTWGRGDDVVVTPSCLDLGERRLGESVSARIVVKNRASRDIHLLGSDSNCSCVVVSDLPMTLRPGEQVELSVRIRYPEVTETFARELTIFVDSDVETCRKVTFLGTARRVPAGPHRSPL